MKGLLLRIGICLGIFGVCLYSYLDLQNKMTQIKIELPEKEREIGLLLEEIRRMSYEIDRFESPTHLIELAHRPEFSHLKHPLLREILTVPEAFATNDIH